VNRAQAIEHFGAWRVARWEKVIDLVTSVTDITESQLWNMMVALDQAEDQLFLQGEELQYSYNPRDGRGTRYVFKNRTCVGLASARDYIGSLLLNAPPT
jgi:hypothetical protein